MGEHGKIIYLLPLNMGWMWGVGYIDLMVQICWIGPSGSFISSGDVSAGSFGFLFFVYFIFVLFVYFLFFFFIENQNII
jgi:hypothetical protein